MAWNFRRRIKIIPGVHLNVSKSGISTSVGIRGASVTFRKKGTYLNTGIPGSGLYNRQRLSGISDHTEPDPQLMQPVDQTDNIFSVDVQNITSQNMQGIKEAIVSARVQRIELTKDLKKVEMSCTISKIKLVASYVLLIAVFKKSIAVSIKDEIQKKKDVIDQLKEQIDNSYVNLDIEFDPDIRKQYERVIDSFKNLSRSARIWDITGAYEQDTRMTRSAASTAVKKTDVEFGTKSLEDIKSQVDTLWMKNANGADLFFYPSFIIMYENHEKFALVGLEELELYHNPVRFVETGSVPHDSTIIDRTWAKVNKNGSPDKRFKGNYQIPIVRYGEISLSSSTGLNEVYQFSNYEYAEAFAGAFLDYQKRIISLKQINTGGYTGQETSENSFLHIDLSERDSFFDEAARLVVASQECNTLFIQQNLRIGPNRAERIIEQLEAARIISTPRNNSNNNERKVLIQTEQELDNILIEINEKYGRV